MQKNLLVLIDTNVWVSAFINRNGYPAKVKEVFVNHEFDIAISPLGWRGTPFFWPVIIAQQNLRTSIFAHETMG